MSNINIGAGKLMHIRALNFVRRDHALTYVGNRIAVDHISTSILDEWTTQYLFSRSMVGKLPVYWQYSLFKGLGMNGELEFRNCLIGSPTTLLQEVWVLWRISQDAVFATHPNVYSYLWPGPKSHKIFRHYTEGYREREKAIAAEADNLTDPTVIVVDLRKFYPSVNLKLAYTRFAERVELSSLSTDEKKIVLQSAQGVCRKRKCGGLPIGPPLAHVIASVYLEEVDSKLTTQFSGRYFRYVDDIAILVEGEDVSKAMDFLDAVVRNEALELNDDKTDIHKADLWKSHVESKSSSQSAETFGGLIRKLTQYLAYHPEKYESLRNAFHMHGFSIPLSNAKSNANYGPFRHLAKWLLNRFSLAGIKYMTNSDHLVLEATRLRDAFKSKAKELHNRPLPDGGIQRRWAIQHVRFVFNRLLYLIPREDLAEFENLLPNVDDLASTRVLYHAYISGDATAILDYPGPVVTAFAQLWREMQTTEPSLDWSVAQQRYHRDSLLILMLYGLCQPPEGWLDQFSSVKQAQTRAALMVAANKVGPKRSFDDFSYMDEIESLFRSYQFASLDLLSTRYDDGEEVYLPALSIGDGSALDLEDDYVV